MFTAGSLFLAFLFGGFFASIIFSPQAIGIMLGSSLIALLSKQVPIVKILIGNVFVILAVGYLLVTPLGMYTVYFSSDPVPSELFWSIEGFMVYILSATGVIYFFWKLRGKLLIICLLPVLLSLLLMQLTMPLNP